MYMFNILIIYIFYFRHLQHSLVFHSILFQNYLKKRKIIINYIINYNYIITNNNKNFIQSKFKISRKEIFLHTYFPGQIY